MATERSDSLFLKVTIPLNEMSKPRSSALLAKASSSVKQ